MVLPLHAKAVVAALCGLVGSHWPALPDPSVLAAQIEQETCVSIRSATCYTSRAELKMPREYGFNYGQITVTATFNNFETAKHLDPSLADWRWEDRLDSTKGLIALLAMDRQAYQFCKPLMGSPADAMACMLAVYNGGAGGFRSDRRVCTNTKGCDPRKWFGNVENTSLKAKKPAAGYGQSFFQINRGYVANVMGSRRPKYLPLTTEEACYRPLR
jgi:hypothetical protein